MRLDGPPDPQGASYRRALALLRLAEVQKLQSAIERTVGELEAIKNERGAAGAAGGVSRSQRSRRTRRRNRLRAMLSDLLLWRGAAGLPHVEGDEVVACMPSEWTDEEVEKVVRGEFCWRVGAGGTLGEVTLKVLGEKYRDAAAEVRCGGCRAQRGVHGWRVVASMCLALHTLPLPSHTG